MPYDFDIDVDRLAGAPDILGYVLPFLREFQRRRSHAYYTYKPDSNPTRNQEAFHSSTAGVRLVFGGNQSGKSRSVAQEVAWWLTGKHPYQPVPKNARIYCISSSYRTLQEGIWRHLRACLPEWETETYGQFVPNWTIPCYIRMKNGNQVDFISGEGREDARRKIQAAELHLGVIDEEVDQLLWEELLPRRLVHAGRIVICATLVRSEPWCMELEDRAECGDPDIHLTRLSTYAACDAGHVKRKIVKEMEALLTEDERDVRLLGKSRKSEGLVYPELSEKNVVKTPFQIPNEWTRFIALDPGYRTFAVLWAAVAPDEKVYIYHELYLHAKHYSEIANAIFAANGYVYDEGLKRFLWVEGKSANIQTIWIDPSTFGHFDSGELKTGNLLANYGLHCTPAQNDVEAGIQIVRRALMPGLDEQPVLKIFRSCENLLKEMRSYRRHKETRDGSRNQRTESPIKRNDHALDCLRYLFLGGLYYVPSAQPWLSREFEEHMQHQQAFQVSKPIGRVLDEQWKQIMARQKNGNQPLISHAMGSEI